MIGVTIGIGEDYLFNAREAAKRFTRYTGLPVVVLTEEYLKEVEHHEVFNAAQNFRDKVFFLKFFLFNFFADDIVYFDSDYCAVDYWNPATKFNGDFTAVRDRVKYLCGGEIIRCDIQRYFNAGFFMASYEKHKSLFDKFIKLGSTTPFKFGDQCIMNKIIQDTKTPVTFLDKRYNCMDHVGVMADSDVKAIHNCSMYLHYKEGTEVKPSDKYKWNLVEMAGIAGLVTVVFEDNHQRTAYLNHDGTTSCGDVWFCTDDHEMYLCENYVDKPRRIKSIYHQ